MVQESLAKRADELLALHVPGEPVVLPTVWDAWSAKLAVDAGFAALTVGSHPVAVSVGKEDGEGLSLPLPVSAIALPDEDDPASFGSLGVGRISSGPFLQRALSGRAEEILARWR